MSRCARFASPQALVRYSEASSFGNLLAHLPVELRPSAREVIGRELAALAAPDGTISQSSRRMVAVAYLRTLPGRLTTAQASE